MTTRKLAAYNKIMAKKDVVIYPEFVPEALPGQVDRGLNFMFGL